MLNQSHAESTCLLTNGRSPVTNCSSCGSSDTRKFFSASHVPVNIGALWDTRAAALACKTGDMDLMLCSNCGLIFNAAFDPDLIDYGTTYDNSLDHSGVFRSYAENLVDRLVDTHDLRNKRIIEIGCGNGSFLDLICQRGRNTGVGFDPSYDGELTLSDRVKIIRDIYGPTHRQEPADFICCRHVLEHIPTPITFLQSIRETIGARNVSAYFEVPNMMHALKELSTGTIIYEHCTYFCTESLANTFRLSGFTVDNVVPGYGDQFLGIEAHCATDTSDVGRIQRKSIAQTANAVSVFQDSYETQSTNLQERLRANGSLPAVVWGAGARAVSLLNALENPQLVHCVIDMNPNKHGKFLAGSGHPIHAPRSLKNIKPGLVVILNTIYADEITALLSSLGVQCEIYLA